MEYELQLKPFEKKAGSSKLIILELTDIQLHTQKMSPSPIGKNITKSLERMEPGRVFSPISDKEIIDNPMTMLERAKRDPVLLKTIQDYQSKGYRIAVRIPQKPVPIIPGKDTVEFMNSTNGRRIIRGLEKHREIN